RGPLTLFRTEPFRSDRNIVVIDVKAFGWRSPNTGAESEFHKSSDKVVDAVAALRPRALHGVDFLAVHCALHRFAIHPEHDRRRIVVELPFEQEPAIERRTIFGVINHLAAAMSRGGFVLLVRRHPRSAIRADFIEFRERPSGFAGENQRVMRVSETRRDLYIGA